MSFEQIHSDGRRQPGTSLAGLIEAVRRGQARLREVPIQQLVELFADYSARLLRDERTRHLEAVMFLAAWLRPDHLHKMLELNLHGEPAYLDGFRPYGAGYLAAQPHGLASVWMAGNVGTLPLFSLVPVLLTKNACLMKLAHGDSEFVARLLAVLGDSSSGELSGQDVLEAAGVVAFDRTQTALAEEMSLAADVRLVWGGGPAVQAITSLPRPDHCVDILFGPKYSLGVIDRGIVDADSARLDEVVAAFVRDIAVFDQRACSSPQTIFVEQGSRPLREAAEAFARHLARLAPKPGLDAFTTMNILNARARWGLDEARDVIASADGTNWTVCLDREVSLKEAVQSRTVFLTEVPSWRDVIPLLSPHVQTVGIAFAERDQALAFASQATAAGVVRCVRPGLMNVFESPWDGKLLVHELVRWVTCKP